jgi:PadR family transcriptional regulator, regulatory protein AphA
MARCNKTAYAILGFISKQPASGYDIKKQFAANAKWYWSESNAQIYPILKRMEAKDCLSSYIDNSSGARQRRIYSITDQGIEKLNAWLQQPVEPTTHREEFFLKFNLSEHLDISYRIQQVRQFQKTIETQLDLIHQQRAKNSDADNNPSLILSQEYAATVWQAKADWCKQTLAKIAIE